MTFTALAVAIGLSVIWAAALATIRPSEGATWINGIYERKEAATRNENPQVLLVGGSATHFSLSAELIGDATGLRVVNFGTHAGLGARYILYRVRPWLKDGDTVVLSLEYSLLWSDTPSEVLVEYVPFFDRSYILHAGVGDALRLTFGLTPMAVLKYEILRKFFLPKNSRLYRPETVSALGDETAGTADAVDAVTRESIRNAGPFDIGPVAPDQPPGALAEFIDWSRKHHVTVLAGWPPTIENKAYSLPPYASFFAKVRSLYEKMGVRMLGVPERYFVPKDDMLDTIYHANLTGQQLLSQRLSEDLCRVMTCPKAMR